MFRAVMLIILSALFVHPAFADNARPETAKYVKAYIGQEGVQVWTLRVGPRDNNEALVQITHIDHELDNKILRCKVQPISNGGKGYVADINGKSYTLLRLKDGGGELYLPGEEMSNIAYSDSLSEQGNAEHFLTEYLDQRTQK